MSGSTSSESVGNADGGIVAVGGGALLPDAEKGTGFVPIEADMDADGGEAGPLEGAGVNWSRTSGGNCLHISCVRGSGGLDTIKIIEILIIIVHSHFLGGCGLGHR
jgi:hypothetical protein